MTEKRPIDENVESGHPCEGDRVGTVLTDGTEAGEPLADGGVQIDTLLSALANDRRRLVLHFVRAEEAVTLDEVSEYVAARETGTPLAEVDGGTMRSVRIDLYHVHLPKLEEAGMIEYDRQRESIRFLPADFVERWLDCLASVEPFDPDGDPTSNR